MSMFGSFNQRTISALLRSSQSNRAIGDMTGTNNGSIGVSHHPNATFIDHDPPGLGTYGFFGVLVSKGPNGESDYTDPRYFVRETVVTLDEGSGPGDLPSLAISTTGFWGPATNTLEIACGNHLLPVYSGDPTKVFDGDAAVMLVWVDLVQSYANDVGESVFVFTAVQPGLFPVLVQQSGGSDGDSTSYATWTYNLFALTDIGMTNTLTVGPIQPDASAARVTFGSVNTADNGSVGMAYIDNDGSFGLWDVQETAVSNTCDDGSDDGSESDDGSL